MTGTPPYIVRTGTPGENEEPAEDLESAIGIAAESIGSAVDPVEIVDSTGWIVFDQPELVDRITKHRKRRGAMMASLLNRP
jgi:hypothetical protein